MKNIFFLLLLTITVFFTRACNKEKSEKKTNTVTEVSAGGGTLIRSSGVRFVITNTYFDNYRQIKKETPDTVLKGSKAAKFLVLFSDDLLEAKDIKSITAYGPDNYRMDFLMQPYSRKNLNGYTDGETLWFQAYDVEGFLKEGKYSIEVEYQNGKKISFEKIFKGKLSLLKKYLITKSQFSPTGNLKPDDLVKLKLKWNLIQGIDAFYCTRLKENLPNTTFTKNLVSFDNIFAGIPGESGKNKTEFAIEADLKSETRYVWFTEVLDSNVLEKVNMAIFMPFQYFKTP